MLQPNTYIEALPERLAQVELGVVVDQGTGVNAAPAVVLHNHRAVGTHERGPLRRAGVAAAEGSGTRFRRCCMPRPFALSGWTKPHAHATIAFCRTQVIPPIAARRPHVP
jgi:hypothetical protein